MPEPTPPTAAEHASLADYYLGSTQWQENPVACATYGAGLATLALYEEQRTANLIAYLAVRAEIGDDTPRMDVLDDAVRARLGLS
jgi:hypothetical protein